MSDSNTAIATCAAVLSVKAVTINLLTSRARMKFSDFTTGRTTKLEEDATMPKFLQTLLKTSLLTNLPSYSVERYSACMHNIVENEPFFLALALALSMTDKAPASTAAICTTYAATRCLHSAVFIHGAPQPFRLIFYAAGVGCTLMLAFSVFNRK